MAQYIKTEEGYKGLEESISAVTDNKMDKTNPTGTGSFSMNRKAGTVVGVNSHAEGYNTTASGYGSHAEGNNTTASGSDSHAEGISTTASGQDSHAEGYQTSAGGKNSHAEGNSTNKFSSVVTKTNPTTDEIINVWKYQKFSVAKGDHSHVEGKDNLALGDDSHAEGFSTTVSGDCSHAEGFNTKASGADSHAEGRSTTASGQDSHAEGNDTTANGGGSHAEGISTTASGDASHAEGYSTNKFSSVVTLTNPTTDEIITAWEKQEFSLAKGKYSHVEGKDNLSLGDSSHAEGNHTTASGDVSHAEGNSTIASGGGSHAEGFNTTASEYYSHAEGSSTIASGWDSHAEGSHTIASGQGSHAEGSNTIASGDDSNAQGKLNIEDTSSIYADIIGNGTIVNGTMIKRSNAATVDWSGNAWFAGDLYTGSTSGTNKDDGSKKLATEEYVNSSIAAGGTDISLGLTSATVGQTIKVKTVDASGKPTAWEAANMQSGGGWDLITDITLTEDGGGGAIANVTRNDKGEEFEYRQCRVCLSGKVIDGWPKGASQYIYLYENNDATGINASILLSRLAAGEGGTEYKTTVEMSIFGNLVRLIACGGSADTSSLIIRNDTSIDTFRSIGLSCYGNNQWTSVPLAAGGRVVIYGRK